MRENGSNNLCGILVPLQHHMYMLHDIVMYMYSHLHSYSRVIILADSTHSPQCMGVLIGVRWVDVVE